MARAALFLFLAISTAACGGANDNDEASATSESALHRKYEVGPGRPYASLEPVIPLLEPGDVVDVHPGSEPYAGGIIFSKPGTKYRPIRIRGIRNEQGVRPVLFGGRDTLTFAANHYVFEGFDVAGGSSRNVFHHADDITIRDTVIRDCGGHGLLGADEGSGSLTLERVEVYACGNGTRRHPVYMATDETAYPGSVFRMQHCYLHDQLGGNAIKSRAERNEIRYNWVEGGAYREIELIGPDLEKPPPVREDSDVVGNVFVKTQGTYVARVGSDGEWSETAGRYRFVNNTFVLAADLPFAAIQVFETVDSIELHNNVFYRLGGGPVAIFDTTEAKWVDGEVLAGSYNWVPTGTEIPALFERTLVGDDPGFLDPSSHDFRPSPESPLVDAGSLPTWSPFGHAFPDPMFGPRSSPPLHAASSSRPRIPWPWITLGAYEKETH
ncbi:hypothetical protein LVJ94_14990 [Pendulispora rubella]|uniref:Right handed beta helix domain-containing protein n=1 Tax=Pendulispora rubella TaxID=2741070 RepID=A0ABZ2LCN4_9BACT